MNKSASVSLLERAGFTIDKPKPVADLLRQNGLDWTVKQTPVVSDIAIIHNAVINYRSDNNVALGIVSDSHYRPVDNIKAFDFIDGLPNFTPIRVGEANGGKKVFIVGKSNKGFELDNGDIVKEYLTFIHGHDGKSGITLLITPIRMFCMNQFNMLVNNADFKYTIKHSGDVETKLDRVHKALKENVHYMMELSKKLKDLTTQKANMEIDKFLDTLVLTSDTASLRVENRLNDIKDTIKFIYNHKADNQNYKGTKFGYLNAVADYVSHASPARHSDMYTVPNAFIKVSTNNSMLNRAYEILMAA